jgi:hypothetical protein
MTASGQGHDGPTIRVVSDMTAMPRVAKYYTDEAEAVRAAPGRMRRRGHWLMTRCDECFEKGE